ncbi:MAG: 2-oxoacid:acceptor oxidoreductase family protein [Myxococcota bacterium]|jgi:2-oxoglutarate ferredoxin oxidoreductase subunit gamma
MPATEVLMAGFGGQGMLLSGKLLAYAAMYSGLEVSWLPSYGPEMRGGTANVTVVISEKQVASPYIDQPRALLVMNQPSLEKFASKVRPGGLIVVNTSLIPVKCDRADCTVVYIDANELATRAGSPRAANLVMLGAYIARSGVVGDKTVEKIIEKEFAGKPKFIPSNLAAFRAGYEAEIAGRKAT